MGAQKYKLSWKIMDNHTNEEAAKKIDYLLSINRDVTNSNGQSIHINDWTIDANNCEAIVDLYAYQESWAETSLTGIFKGSHPIEYAEARIII